MEDQLTCLNDNRRELWASSPKVWSSQLPVSKDGRYRRYCSRRRRPPAGQDGRYWQDCSRRWRPPAGQDGRYRQDCSRRWRPPAVEDRLSEKPARAGCKAPDTQSRDGHESLRNLRSRISIITERADRNSILNLLSIRRCLGGPNAMACSEGRPGWRVPTPPCRDGHITVRRRHHRHVETYNARKTPSRFCGSEPSAAVKVSQHVRS